MRARELFDRIPEHLRDEPHPDLLDQTPRQAVGHVEDFGCQMCREILWRLGE